jgi:predicted outer membrane repeat protein
MKMSQAQENSMTPVQQGRKGMFFLLSVIVGLMIASANSAQAKPAWYDGQIQYSNITNCPSIIQGLPYQEKGGGTYVGFIADPEAGLPAVNSVYYAHLVIVGLGNSCSGMRAYIDLSLPPNTSLAIDSTNKVFCFYNGSQIPADQCPQTFQPSPYNQGSFWIPSVDTAHARTWPIPLGQSLEIQIPLRSTTKLNSGTLQGHIWMLDGNANPWLRPTQGVYVFNQEPSVLYPNPSTTEISETGAKSETLIYTYGIAGTAFLELGKTTSYEIRRDSVSLPAGQTGFSVWNDWLPTVLTPNTLYHWRARFISNQGTEYVGADQIFQTLPSTVTVGTGTASSCTATALSSAISTAGGKTVVFKCGNAPTTIVLSSSISVSSSLVIDGGGLITLDGDGARRHFAVQSPNQLTLKNLTLSNGENSATRGSSCGGAIQVASGAKLIAEQVRFLGNHSGTRGGALCNDGTATVTNCVFKSNTSNSHGGAIQSAGTLKALNCFFESNIATGNGGLSISGVGQM